ncbi:MAG TPA: isoleucine--tRNA ligase [Acidimicrobiales bacterium]|nr:isoleucine--tRNA ligase [Acidimicrobiales bacterium]
MFRPIPPEVDFVALENEELSRWAAHNVFARSVAQREGGPPWIFYEGPPTANGKPGLHHVWARVYKDLFCRFRTMRGYHVARRAGWDTHGLPVEVEVEKRLGIGGKRQIEEEVGIAEFVRLCRESVLSYVGDWRDLTVRIGYWVDLDDAYWTLDPGYIESVWWHLRQLFDQGLLYEDLKVVPYCPRCGTGLSSHELGQADVYQDEEDESAYVRLPLVDADPAELAGATSLLVWTTTPWTLVSNTGVAVHPDLTYAVVDGMLIADALVEDVMGAGAALTGRVRGADLVGLRYRRPLDLVDAEPGANGWRVVAADFVTTDEGTGLVHLAPAFGEVDRQIGRDNGLPTINPVGPDGRFTAAAGWLAGREVRGANHDINDALEAEGLLERRLPYVHSYPHCWRCQTALIYWGKPSWYVATSTRKDELLAANQTIDWHPAYIRDGRFGEWLANNVDWALSRDRFWGTPLPIWRCGSGHVTCVGSLAELSDLTGRDLSGLDPHRPVIDEVVFPCPRCREDGSTEAATARRVEAVIDAWFDSGSMPAARVGYPDSPGSAERFEYPADFISEAIDQTRGWFYSLLAVNTLVFGSSPYRHVVCLGHIVDARGRKASKSLGNVLDPWEVLDSRGADPLRWWMFSQGSPWTPTQAGLPAIDVAMRETLLTLWNTFSFFTTYAAANGFDPADPDTPEPSARPGLDRWLLSRLASATEEITEALDLYDPYRAATALARLVDEISNWYVRRSRRRFWHTDPDAPESDSLSAQATLHETLCALSLLLAPFCPFTAERLWRELTGAAEGDSVHLADWPEPAPALVDRELEAEMAQARRLSSLGRAARSEAGIKVRQPLSRALVFLSPDAPRLLADIVASELNVDRVEVTAELGELITFKLVPNFRLLGPRLGPRVQEAKAALAQLDGAAVAAALEEGRPVRLTLAGGDVELAPGEVELQVRGQEGYAVSREGGEVVALDVALDDDLRLRGLLRDVIRQVQDLRKEAGLEVTDRIRLTLSGADRLAPFFDQLAREVLAVVVRIGTGSGPGSPIELGGETGLAWIERAS